MQRDVADLIREAKDTQTNGATAEVTYEDALCLASGICIDNRRHSMRKTDFAFTLDFIRSEFELIKPTFPLHLNATDNRQRI